MVAVCRRKLLGRPIQISAQSSHRSHQILFRCLRLRQTTIILCLNRSEGEWVNHVGLSWKHIFDAIEASI